MVEWWPGKWPLHTLGQTEWHLQRERLSSEEWARWLAGRRNIERAPQWWACLFETSSEGWMGAMMGSTVGTPDPLYCFPTTFVLGMFSLWELSFDEQSKCWTGKGEQSC